MIILGKLNLSSANAFNLVKARVLLFGKEIRYCKVNVAYCMYVSELAVNKPLPD